MVRTDLIVNIQKLLQAYNDGLLGETIMPEDTHPRFFSEEEKFIYFTLPMALNYQRNSYKLWESAKKTWEDPETKNVFNIEKTANSEDQEVRILLQKHKLGIQPNKHTDTWVKISKTLYENWGSLNRLLEDCDHDYILLRDVVQEKFKKGFPYLSGPKIFNYWSYILIRYCEVELKNRNLIEIAPDTHVIQASVRLGVIGSKETKNFSREMISQRWRELLEGTGIDPIDMHSPLWFWSRGKFQFTIG